jgi:hypothetical protein
MAFTVAVPPVSQVERGFDPDEGTGLRRSQSKMLSIKGYVGSGLRSNGVSGIITPGRGCFWDRDRWNSEVCVGDRYVAG